MKQAMSIKTRMSVIACSLVAGFLVLTAVPAYIYITGEFKKQISDEQFALTRHMAAHFDDKIAMAREKIAKFAAAVDPAEVSDPAGLRKFLEIEQKLQTFFDRGMYVISLDGRVVASTSRVSAPGAIPSGELDALMRGATVTNACIPPFVSSVYGSTPCLTVAAPVCGRSGKPVAVLAGRLDVTKEHFLGELAALKMGSTGYVYVVDSRRTLIMHPDRSRILETLRVGANKGIEEALQGFEGTLENTNSRGVRGLTSFKRLSSADWILAVHLPLNEAYGSLYRVRLYFGVMLTAATLCSAMLVWFAMGRLVAPLLSLTRHVGELAGKHGGERLVRIDTEDEIGDLARAFNGMVREIEQQREELLMKHEELQKVFRQVAQGKREWELTLDCIGDLVIMTDTAGRVRRCNRAVAEFARRPVVELIGQPWPEAVILPEVEISGFADKGGEIYHGGTNRWFVITCYPFAGMGAEEGGAVITLHDVTEAKRFALELERANAELKETHSQMLQKEKMASIGQLAAGVAHEINNPMGFITSNLGTLRKYADKMLEFMAFLLGRMENLPDPEGAVAAERKRLKLDYVTEDLGNLIAESLEGAERVRKIVADLKSFSRVDEAESTVVDLHGCLESTINIVWNELKYKATLKKEYGELPPLRCYPQQLNQVFMNLLVNAAHAIENQGEITVRTWAEGEWVCVAVEDTGCGIPEDVRERIFEPFFTTKEVGKGTGLGLSISYDIVKKHGGEITVASEPEKGTTFVVRLPTGGAGPG